MKNREKKKWNKIIDKHYHLYGPMYQRLYVNSMEVMDKDSCSLDIHLWDEKKKEFGLFLFIVQNYNGFKGSDIVPPQHYFRPYKVIETWDGVGASFAPLFRNENWYPSGNDKGTYNLFTLPKFTGITKEDVIKCTSYFCKVVLDNYWIWNVCFGTSSEDKNQLEFDWKGINGS